MVHRRFSHDKRADIRRSADSDAGVTTDDGYDNFRGLAEVAQNFGNEGGSADNIKRGNAEDPALLRQNA